MSIEDKIAKSLIRKHAKVLSASGWFTEAQDLGGDDEPALINYKSARLLIGDTEISCKIADDDELQVKGLQGHNALGPYEGMIFPYYEPRRVAFHMGKVSFSIDIIFVADDSRVSKIVENVEPGSPGQWGMPHISAVIEVNGGFCAAHSIEVGSEVGQFTEKRAQVQNLDISTATAMFPDAMAALNLKWPGLQNVQLYQYMDTLGAAPMDEEMPNTEIPAPEMYWDGDQWVVFGSPVARCAQEKYPRYPRKDLNPEMVTPNDTPGRFRDRDLGEERMQFTPHDPKNFDESQGYDQTKLEQDQTDIGPSVRLL